VSKPICSPIAIKTAISVNGMRRNMIKNGIL
jgi:hypothetical protein